MISVNKEIDINEINGKDYILLDNIKAMKTTYYFYVSTTDSKDIQILKETVENNEKYIQSIDSEKELMEAYALFYEKHKNDNYEGAAN